MHDIRAIRDDPYRFDRALARRGIGAPSREEVDAMIPPDHQRAAADGSAEGRVTFDTYSEFVLTLDETRRLQIKRAEEGQQRIKALSREAGAAKRSGDEERFSELQRRSSDTKDVVVADQSLASDYNDRLRNVLLAIPNLPYDDVPDGPDETANREIRRWGEPRRFNYPPREHFDLPAASGLDFETAAKLSGSRFVLLRGAMARLHRALAQFMLDTHTRENGLTEVSTPVLVRDEAMLGTGQLPKFQAESFRTEEGFWLIPTSEVTLTNTVAGAILDEAALPIRLTAHTLCFRSEAGSAGRDTRGMLRHHQFEKVEMVSITKPEDSRAEHARMTRLAEGILERLGLPYRTVVLCTGDMGFGARITHDIEVWLPGQGAYREISSVSDTGAFQARRMNARYRPEGGGRPEFVHTLNGSGLAVGRCLIAVLENGQEEDGSVTLPEALAPWIGGARRITAEGALE